MPIFGKSIQFFNKNFGREKEWKIAFAKSKWKTLHRLEDLDTKIKCFWYKLNSQRGVFYQYCFSVVGAEGGCRKKSSWLGWTFPNGVVRTWLPVPKAQDLAQRAQRHRWFSDLLLAIARDSGVLAISTRKAQLRAMQPLTFPSHLASPLRGHELIQFWHHFIFILKTFYECQWH